MFYHCGAESISDPDLGFLTHGTKCHFTISYRVVSCSRMHGVNFWHVLAFSYFSYSGVSFRFVCTSIIMLAVIDIAFYSICIYTV